MPTILEPAGSLPPSTRVAIAVSRYNESVTHRLLDAAVATLVAGGVADDSVDVAWVPGGFELPFAADRLAATGRYAAVLCLGAIIRGETSHDRYIAQAAAAGIEACGRTRGIPVIFGLLTCDTLAQAVARAGGGQGNKGHECAEAAIAMIRLSAAISTRA